MLRRTRVSTVLSPCRLGQARIFHQGAGLGSEQAQASHNFGRHAGRMRPRVENSLLEEPNSAFLRGKTFLRSPAQALAVIRAVERKYGAVREYKLLKDFELPTHYQCMVYIAFQDPKAFKRIPVATDTFSVTLPFTIPNRPGGVGLDELEPVLKSEEYIGNSNIPTFGDVMDNVVEDAKEEVSFTIERRDTNWHTPHRFGIGAGSPSEDIARSFIEWGGFHELQPIPADTSISNKNIFLPSAVDHARMRLALRTHSEMFHIPNPYETLSTTAPETSGPALDWEPLPGHESTPTDTPMPSAILAASEQPSMTTQTSDPGPQSTPPTPSTVTHTLPDAVWLPTSPETAAPIPASIAEVEAIAASMGKPPSRPKQTTQTTSSKKKKSQGQVQKPDQNSLRGIRNQTLQARQKQSAKRSQKQQEFRTPTVKEKISNFFSNIF